MMSRIFINSPLAEQSTSANQLFAFHTVAHAYHIKHQDYGYGDGQYSSKIKKHYLRLADKTNKNKV